jgi:DNA-binding response OmpR family regulator
VIAHKLLIVDDDPLFIDLLIEQLSLHDELSVDTALSAAKAREKLDEQTYDIVILDIELPDQDGRELCRYIRKIGINIPIIFLSGNASEADTILGLEAGATDYVVKPFKFGVLLARIRAHLRQVELSDRAVLNLGRYLFRPALKILEMKDGTKIKLTEKESHILRYLHRANGQIVGRLELLNEVWGYQDGVTTHTLETHIYRLRQKIEPTDGSQKILLTDEGGYRLAL